MNFLEKVPEIYNNEIIMRLLFDSLLKMNCKQEAIICL